MASDSSVGMAAAFLAFACAAATRRARLASEVTVFSRTSSITAIGALSPLRASILMIRV
ncbi:Uncharacterised protein [Mycobacterium tuberculosis]|nr:Uncharacterised protein [Mycobacterium tuberculosis]